jgi:hypothetical protein
MMTRMHFTALKKMAKDRSLPTVQQEQGQRSGSGPPGRFRYISSQYKRVSSGQHGGHYQTSNQNYTYAGY